MIRRSALILFVAVLLAAGTFRFLLMEEIDRVLSIHVTDKASHMLDMLTMNAQSLDALVATASSATFVEMALASHVASVHFFGPDGAPQDYQYALSALRPATKEHSDHADVMHSSHGHHHGTEGAQLVIDQIAKVAPPDRQALQSLIDGGRRTVFSSGKLVTEEGETAVFGQVSMPAYSSSGTFLGIVSFTLNASHIQAVMAHGSKVFGLAFTLFGAVLFGVPALAFWIQKQLAERSARDLGYLSRHDALTGLLNRQTFSTEAQKLLTKGQISVIGYIDVDRFKLINDTYGHSVGDAFLEHIANLLRKALGEKALVARFGGDEFVFALDKQDKNSAQHKVEHLRRNAAEEIILEGFSVAGSISIGITELHRDDNLDDTLQRADMALYAAKSQGRDQIAVYHDAMGESARRRQRLEARLREACSCGAFELAFQPLVNAQSSEIEGYEALLRLKCADGHVIPPSEFIPLAEEIGLIEEIGKWVLFNGTRQISAFDDVSSVSINLSAEQFKSGNLVDYVNAALMQSGLPPHRLELEITESILLQQDSHIEYQIDALKEMGTSIAMDDFGTGFSSLSTLWRYGFDRIKIDKSFVHALEESPERSQQLIDSIILLGARMGMRITAEGIETRAQRELLRDLGCDTLQGYYFGKPQALTQDEEAWQRNTPANW